MNGDPDNDAQAMAMSRAKTPSEAASLMVCIGNLKRRGAGAELKGQIFFGETVRTVGTTKSMGIFL
jgi:hypothetical protein